MCVTKPFKPSLSPEIPQFRVRCRKCPNQAFLHPYLVGDFLIVIASLQHGGNSSLLLFVDDPGPTLVRRSDGFQPPACLRSWQIQECGGLANGIVLSLDKMAKLAAPFTRQQRDFIAQVCAIRSPIGVSSDTRN